jgi:hypothetical protein
MTTELTLRRRSEISAKNVAQWAISPGDKGEFFRFL